MKKKEKKTRVFFFISPKLKKNRKIPSTGLSPTAIVVAGILGRNLEHLRKESGENLWLSSRSRSSFI